MSFKVLVDKFLELRISEVKLEIERAKKIPISELKLFDLLINENTGKALRHGVYIFFNDREECLYVGKCSSSHFAHRIGGHFGMSPKYGMNDFLKRTVGLLKLGSDYSSYVDALPIISNYKLLIIDASGRGKEFISSLEKLLHKVYKPTLNFPKGYPKTYKSVDAESQFLSAMAECKTQL
jgi:hypothetical protein